MKKYLAGFSLAAVAVIAVVAILAVSAWYRFAPQKAVEALEGTKA